MTEKTEAPGIVVNASPAADQIAAAVRTLILVISVITALAALASKRDLAGFIVYAQSSEFLQAASVAIGIGTFIWGQAKTRYRAKQLAAIAGDDRVPDAVASVKGLSA